MKQLRPYQQEAIEATLTRLNEGVSKSIISLPTGGGKTFTAVMLRRMGGFKRTLFCADTEELVDQSAMAFVHDIVSKETAINVQEAGFLNYIEKNPSIGVGAIKASTFVAEGEVVVCSLQTLHRRLHKLKPDDFDLVIVDECHGAMAPTVIKSLNFLKPKLLCGLSATPMRFDGLQLSDLFQEIVYNYGIGDAIKDGYLVELDAIKVKTNINLDKVKTKGGDLNDRDLSNEINVPARNFLIANKWLEYCNGRQTIAYCVDIRHAIDLCEAFKEKGINADVVSSNEELTGNRTAKVAAYKAGEIMVLMNVMVLSKGFDDDNTSCIITGRPTKSETLFRQMVGRGTRTLKGVIDGIEDPVERFKAIKRSAKKECIILDISDNTSKHNLVNCYELDKYLPPEERVFTTQEKKDKIIAERMRRAKLEHEQLHDEIVKLISLPRVVISKSLKMSEDATEAQLAVIKRWGYDTENTHYSKSMISEIFGKQPASANDIEFLKRHNYDVAGRFVSVAEAQAAQREIMNRKVK